MADRPHKVVIIGGGFAGLNAAIALRNAPVEVTLIDRRNFHLFQPLLYQVATGGLSPGDISAPLRHVLGKQKNTRVLLGEVTGFDLPRRRVLMIAPTPEHDAPPGREPNREIEFDSLILAAGADNFYFGHDEWERFAPGLKSIEDATHIRRRVFLAFEEAEQEPDVEKRKALLRFVIAGAGPTGVEMAGTISEIARDTLRGDFRHIRPEESEVILIDASTRVLPPFAPDISEIAERALLKLGVRCRTGLMVVGIDRDGVTLEDKDHQKQRIATRTVIWAAGVRASKLCQALTEAAGAQTDRGGRALVQPDLSLPGHPELFVLGDLAHLEEDGKMLPGMAPVAIQQGRYIGKLIRARIENRSIPPFHYRDRGMMATIGRNAAVADLGFIHFGGILAWLAWLFIHLMYLVGFQNRVVVLVQWAFQYFTFNRGARLITDTIKDSSEQ